MTAAPDLGDELLSRERLAGYDPEMLHLATVLVVGAGALGQNLVVDLALSGVGELRIVDADRFELHNRTRSPLFPTPTDRRRLGDGKARVVAAKALPLMTAPEPRVRHAGAWVQELGAGAFLGVDVVASCVDNPAARAYLADMTRWLGLSLVEGGFDGPATALSWFPACDPDDADPAPCWRCSNPEEEGTFSCAFYAGRAEIEGVIPALQTAAGGLAALQSEAIAQALHGRLEPVGRQHFDVRSGAARRVRLARDPRCPGRHETIDEPPSPLAIGADATVEDLLAAVKAVGDGAHPLAPPAGDVEIALPHTLVVTAPCVGCGQLARPKPPAPEWRWRRGPRCAPCGGTFARDDQVGLAAAEVVTSVAAPPPDALARLRCRELGLAPLSLVEARCGARDLVVRLSGDLDEIFAQAASPPDP